MSFGDRGLLLWIDHLARVEFAGWRSRRIAARMTVPELPGGTVELRAYATPDAREVQPLNTALAANAAGRAAIDISLVAMGA